VHFPLRLSRTMTLADSVSELKTSSSKWMKEQSPGLSKFSWQRAYGAFSIGPKARSGGLGWYREGRWPSVIFRGRFPRLRSLGWHGGHAVGAKDFPYHKKPSKKRRTPLIVRDIRFKMRIR
jgi:hypothetical protein